MGETGGMSGEAASRTSLDLPGRQLELAQKVHRDRHGQRPSSSSTAVRSVSTGSPSVRPPFSKRGFREPRPAMRSPTSCSGRSIRVASCRSPFHAQWVRRPSTTTTRPLAGLLTRRTHYTSKYLDVPWTPLFPFGHGLSYTEFRLNNLRLGAARMSAGGTLDVSVDVANVGARAGDEVVQLYLQDLVASVTRPVQELKGFQRVTLEPGQTPTAHVPSGATGSWLLRPRDEVGGRARRIPGAGEQQLHRRAHRHVRGEIRQCARPAIVPLAWSTVRRCRQSPESCSFSACASRCSAPGDARAAFRLRIRTAPPNFSGQPSLLKTRPCSRTSRSGRSSFSGSRQTRAPESCVTAPARTVRLGGECAGCRKHRLGRVRSDRPLHRRRTRVGPPGGRDRPRSHHSALFRGAAASTNAAGSITSSISAPALANGRASSPRLTRRCSSPAC